ncbi:beta-defensin 15-like [Erinaceus europaeus]|uniref:Beta-defensin n=1 Tax=Erinaceus europaeus TaxID=9365 RepID=A0A1S3W550_ERIEU|nr:beta-defensin 15-like [Erinaceus europaeus]
MRTLLFLFVLLFFLGPAMNKFLDEKCIRLDGRCSADCKKNEELVGLCHKAQKCCLLLEPCWQK